MNKRRYHGVEFKKVDWNQGKRPAIYIFPRRIAAEKMTPRRTTGMWVS